MLRVNQVKITPREFYEDKENRNSILRKKITKLLHIQDAQIEKLTIVKQSIDARKKPDLYFSLVLDVKVAKEQAVLKHCKDHNVSLAPDERYHFPKPGSEKLSHPPIIVGAGPAGLFCAYMLSLHGYCPIVLERGEDAETRLQSVTEFWETGKLDLNSNVQFGEGGAGTFSDGKLNTLVKDKNGRNKEVLRIFVAAGAPEHILYENKPHLGTDTLIQIVKNMRDTILQNGGSVLFRHQVTDFIMDAGRMKGVVVNHDQTILSDQVVLAIGHSSRDTIEKLYERNIPMEAKSFAVGLRVEHPQKLINQSQYGMEFPGYLSAAPYKVTAKTSNGRGVYSFCMCPGGYVVNASSEENRLAINGMSYSKRDSANANSAIIVSVTPEDYGGEDALAGIRFQRKLEEKAYFLGQGHIPLQYYDDFKKNVPSTEQPDRNKPCMKGIYTYTNVRELLPESLNESFIEGMEQFGRVIRGFNREDTLVSGVESRTSSPVRIHRDERLQSEVHGLYPCGEGAGYAGGITSAAMDGLKVAEAIRIKYAPF
ncbi:MAG: NAD(P)-binding protein [Lachnospiraceae bacterium]|nr:NAD(P)-binding protein [Lachnospiraceae bacterium]